MKRREIPVGERRVVSKKKKLVILALFAAGILAVAWFKLPYTKTYSAVLICTESGERPLYGEKITVEVSVRIQRNFFADAKHTGTVCVEGDLYPIGEGGKTVPARNLFGAFTDADTFFAISGEWHGEYWLERCAVSVNAGRIVSLTLHDGAGVYAGRYARQQ